MSGHRVLIVEDQPDCADSLKTLLGLSGYEVKCVQTRRDAPAAAAIFRPAIAVVDLGLPDGDGAGVVQMLKALDEKLAVVVFTGYTDPERLRCAREAGATVVLIKPADPEDLLKHIWRFTVRGETS